MMALMLIAMLASLALPGLVRGAGPAALRVAGFEVAALLREDRTSAISASQSVTTLIGADRLSSGATGRTLRMPEGITMSAPSRFIFRQDGHTSGGTILIASARATMLIAVSPDTGAIHVAMR
jgi:hypothetical protein